jgi:hypothetical protein
MQSSIARPSHPPCPRGTLSRSPRAALDPKSTQMHGKPIFPRAPARIESDGARLLLGVRKGIGPPVTPSFAHTIASINKPHRRLLVFHGFQAPPLVGC